MATKTMKLDTTTGRVTLASAGVIDFFQEKPDGVINGVNTVFTLTYEAQNQNSVVVWVDAIPVPRENTPDGFQLSNGDMLVLGTPPAPGQSVYVFYARA